MSSGSSRLAVNKHGVLAASLPLDLRARSISTRQSKPSPFVDDRRFSYLGHTVSRFFQYTQPESKIHPKKQQENL